MMSHSRAPSFEREHVLRNRVEMTNIALTAALSVKGG
jgi:hypothetical protein